MRPGQCKKFQYKFQVKGPLPVNNVSSPISFALRSPVREQIKKLLKDDVIEVSHATNVNTFIIVQRGDKTPRIYLDAGKINQLTFPDRTKAPSIQELLQRFHGARYITVLALTSAFQQIPLHETSRSYTAINFEGLFTNKHGPHTASKNF
jgi:hypothetical protein